MESLRWKEKGVSRIKESPSLKYDTAQRETDVNSKGPLLFFGAPPPPKIFNCESFMKWSGEMVSKMHRATEAASLNSCGGEKG